MGMWRVAHSVPRWQAGRWLNCASFTLLGALAGARVGYAALHTRYFFLHPLEIFFIWQGGLSGMGAWIGALFAMLLVALRWHWSFAKTADGMTPLAAPLAITTWLGCWASGVAYGVALPPGIPWGVPAADETGSIGLRLPVQALAALSLLLFFLWLEIKERSWRQSGQRSSVTCLGVALNLLFFSFLRADPAPSWGGLRPDSWAGLLFTLASLGAVVWCFLPSWREGRPSLEI
jgi:phosphatidylglycerol---prolipoprotein diacylglyceryl transferase